MDNMFEKAVRKKLRFKTSKGLVTVEDLWDMPLTSSTQKTSLDDLARVYHKAIRESEEMSFVKPVSTGVRELELQFALVKHVIDVKMDENEKARLAQENKAKKERIMSIIAEKKDAELAGKPIEELEALVANL